MRAQKQKSINEENDGAYSKASGTYWRGVLYEDSKTIPYNYSLCRAGTDTRTGAKHRTGTGKRQAREIGQPYPVTKGPGCVPY